MATHIWGTAPATGSGGDTVVLATQAAAEVIREGIADAAVQADSSHHISDIVQAIVRFSGFFSYLTGRWSLACFTVSLILNRITIYASTRRRLQLDWSRRFALRIIPIVLFIAQIHALLRALRCQTSPDYSAIRYGKRNTPQVLDYAGNGGFLYTLSSTLLPWETDEQSCRAVHMGRPVNGSDISYGSFSLLWPAFLRLCISHFVETLCCALQGRSVGTEAGMSLFEHSLAFAEAESAISQSLGIGIFGLSKHSAGKEGKLGGGQSVLQSLSKGQVLERMNISPELLLITLISCCNSLTSNILDVFGKQSQYRLVNTTFWGLCFMSAIAWVTFGDASNGTESLPLRIPTVCLVGFVPHLFILLGIFVCVFIYALALVITAFTLPLDSSQDLSLKERLLLAHENMQGAHQIQSIRFNRHDDFYTTSLRIGYGALTAARQAVFLNEGRGVVAQRMTWLERDRLREIESLQRKGSRGQGRDSEYGDLRKSEELLELAMEATAEWEWESGYAREKKIETSVSQSARSQDESEGVGALRGAVRCYQSISFVRAIFYFLLKWTAYGLDKLLSKVGINRRPQWLKTLVRAQQKKKDRGRKNNLEKLDFWIMSEDGVLKVPTNSDFDVENEMRRRERIDAARWGESDERRLDEKLYDWWRAGGAWGNQDQSPDYAPSVEDWDDTTSVVSMATTSDSDWEAYESDGRRTPTQEDPFPGRWSREDTPVQEPLVDIGAFARLLDPRDQESRQEARILAAHLAAGREGRIMTRRRFQQQVERDRARVLLTSRFSQLGQQNSGDDKRKPTPEEESEILERLILLQRSESFNKPSDEQTWESGASGLGPSGPPCVICQTSPRSIITWPCRCLCICEDCRVSLAMNNFGSCVTCRRDVGGFVRLWVP
ncbi:putative ubiquitin-protein ligase (Asi3) [Aspergillus homomorphus CBS 101889]|uniref:Ubiquitin-protein ligase n=1 Tax=Aspergillus homomorphus (strain CBS 101889) TaxID=1450537 RepID=A0A395I7G4_ASPHC|nr:hypothetical protein BO97DRAFT_336942 [Aspergillus homomorphus CBS 101889]RAL15749.1 hypothetical protein BO97DRAFT_336942 [Aspergillus homomorphus CBS 101889]